MMTMATCRAARHSSGVIYCKPMYRYNCMNQGQECITNMTSCMRLRVLGYTHAYQDRERERDSTRQIPLSLLCRPPFPESFGLSNPDGVLAPPHSTIGLVAGLLGRSRLPDLPKFEVLICSARRHRRPVGAEGARQYTAVVCWHVVNLLERGVRP